MLKNRQLQSFIALAATAALVACGGGGGTPATSSTSTGTAAVSSGAVTAFGSVFVNGHEFDTTHATVIDDDTGLSSAGTTALEVGSVVDVKSAAGSSASSPAASELHVHPLVRGVVDASNTSTGVITVMGQTVQLGAATNFSDHRACLSATTSPCTAISGQSGLTATSGSGSAAVAGSYVSVDGYLYASGSVSAGANVVATLVSVHDAPTATSGAGYKTEGVVTAASASSITIGALTIDLSSTSCRANGSSTPCAGAFSVGEVVSTFSATAPALPATAFSPTTALLRPHLPVETSGASVELEGQVSSVTSAPAAFVIRGVSIDASALSGSLPVVGDVVRVTGTVSTSGTAITASALSIIYAVPSASYGFAGTLSSVSTGAAADTYVISLLGQSIAVDASTRLADLSVRGGMRGDSSTNPFNITTFQTYLAASTSQTLQVQTAADASGNLTALSIVILPASTVSSVSGVVDATPAPVDSSTTGTPTTFSVHGVAVSADPSAIVGTGFGRHGGATTVVSAGDYVIVRGSYAAGTLTVAAASGTPSAFASNLVLDAGVPPTPSSHGCF